MEGRETNGEREQGPTEEENTPDTTEVTMGRAGSSDPDELRARLGMKDSRIRELYEEITAFRLAADEALASRQAGEAHIESLESESARLKERIRSLEEEARGRRRRRDGSEKQIARLEKALEKKDGEVAHRDYLLERRAEQLEAVSREARDQASRKDLALRDALRRVDGLERDLEARENEILALRSTVESVRGDLEGERELRGRLADPANRLRAGIDLFNESGQRRSMSALSKTMGQPEVHVQLAPGEAPLVLLTFTWQGVTWQTYVADPAPDVEEPRVYLKGAGEDLSGVNRNPPNARVGPGEKVMLGL